MVESDEQRITSLKEKETCELANRPFNAKEIQNRWVTRVKMSCDGKVRFEVGLVVKDYAQNKEL